MVVVDRNRERVYFAAHRTLDAPDFLTAAAHIALTVWEVVDRNDQKPRDVSNLYSEQPELNKPTKSQATFVQSSCFLCSFVCLRDNVQVDN